MPGDFTEQAMTVLLDAGLYVMEDRFQREADQVREDLAVDVEYIGDGRVIRSQPGEPPRRETGDLQGSIDTSAEIAGDEVVTLLDCNDWKGRRLNEGDGQIRPRPFWDFAYQRLSDTLATDASTGMADRL
jgi:hypothetical protein